MNFIPYTMPHFLSQLLRLATHWEWAWLFCTGEHSQHRSAAQLPWLHGHFAFLCVHTCTDYLSFCASCIKLYTPGCPAVLAWLRLQVLSMYTQIHVLLFIFWFTRMKQPCTLPTICSNPCATQLLTGLIFPLVNLCIPLCSACLLLSYLVNILTHDV